MRYYVGSFDIQNTSSISQNVHLIVISVPYLFMWQNTFKYHNQYLFVQILFNNRIDTYKSQTWKIYLTEKEEKEEYTG
jgi:hypothetical protein